MRRHGLGRLPRPLQQGAAITGLSGPSACRTSVVFHAGTARKGRAVLTNGGRVLGVTALGDGRRGHGVAYEAVDENQLERGLLPHGHRPKALERLGQAPAVGILMGSESDLPVMEEAGHAEEVRGAL